MASHIECAEEGLAKVEKAGIAVLCFDDGLYHVLWDGLGLVLFKMETTLFDEFNSRRDTILARCHTNPGFMCLVHIKVINKCNPHTL